MIFDPERDAQRTNWALGISSLACTWVLLVAGLSQWPWRPIVEQTSSRGEIERCVTCHGDWAAQPGHPEKVHIGVAGCTDCHGGWGHAVRIPEAHHLTGAPEREPLLRSPYLQAGCVRCHVPGSVRGMEHVVAGAHLFLRLGCALCHRLSHESAESIGDGTDLRTLGQKSREYLEQSILQPDKDFPQSPMPSFADTFKHDPSALADVITYVLSLSLTPPRVQGRTQTSAGVTEQCGICHTAASPAGSGAFTHRCLYLQEEAAQLNCAACHARTAWPKNDRRCPVVTIRRNDCAACHP